MLTTAERTLLLSLSSLRSCASCRLYSRGASYPNFNSEPRKTEERSSSFSSGSGDDRRQRHKGGGAGGRGGWKHDSTSLETGDYGTRTVIPVKVERYGRRNARVSREQDLMRMDMNYVKKEFRKEIRDYGDPLQEPDLGSIDGTFQGYVKDVERIKDNIKVKRQTSKHFKDMNPWHKEASLLTWAEKESIRYLHESDPEQWTPEAISQAYPISPNGVEKLVKGSMRLRTVKDVQRHDANIAARLQEIKEGKVEMTEELEKRLKVRELVPFRPGDLGLNPDIYVDTSLPKKLGAFASLVASPQKKEKVAVKEPVVEYMVEGGMCDMQTKGLKPQLNKEELKQILPTNKRMTFAEFQSRMEGKGAAKIAGDMKYMLEDIRQDSIPSREVEEILKDGSKLEKQVVQKYRRPEEEGQLVELRVEGEQSYLYQPESGYQKPYENASNAPSFEKNGVPPNKIIIPEELRGKAGATYKVGDCYYDEDGEFLYKVI